MKNNKKKISICIPCFNEEENINPLYKALSIIIDKNKKYNYELIFVDNGSLDKTKKQIQFLARNDRKVIGVFLSRNFGPEASSQASFDYASGDAIIGMAADFQNPPEMIPEFIKKWETGSKIVFGTYTAMEENFIMNLTRRIFYKVFNAISSTNISMNVTGFGLIDKQVLTAYRSLSEKYRFGRGLISWLGFKIDYIFYKKQKRFKGKSSYSFLEYIKAAERGIFGFSYLILDLMIYSGFILVIFSFVFVIGYLFTVLVYGNPIKASIPLMLSIVFFGGIQLLAISIIGKYIQVIVEETKARPTYIIESTVNFKKK